MVNRIQSLGKSAIEKITGMYLVRQIPEGTEMARDVRRHLPNLHIGVVLDVGANEGQSIGGLLNVFPGATIHSIEPTTSAFAILHRHYGARSNIHCYNVAIGASSGDATMKISEFSRRNRIVESTSSHQRSDEVVQMQTLDDFCKEHDIDHITFLKIDTEGYDLEVLNGATRILETKSVDLIQVEAGMNRHNTLHVPFHEFQAFLEDRGYFLFRIYEQVNEWTTHEPHLRRTNPVYISRRVIETNTVA